MDGSLFYRRCEDRDGKHPAVSRYRYDPDGRLREASGGGITCQYTCTENGLLKSKSASGKLQTLRYGNGLQTEYHYQEDGSPAGLVTMTAQGKVLL